MKSRTYRKRLLLILISAIIFSFIQSVSSFAADNLNYYYDDLNRLYRIEDTANCKKVEYQYDEVGNRLIKQTIGAVTITASAGSNGTISPSGALSVCFTDNASRSYTITPDSGYEILNVLVDGASVGIENTYTFTNITSNHTISASFAVYTPPVQVGGAYYSTLQAAYNAAGSGTTIKVKAKTFTESLDVNRDIAVTIEGGYDLGYTGITGNTYLKGKIQTYASGGTLTIKNFVLNTQ